jgi:FMN hydrolase / 5-amino-6-(5-phospho-D-ribitylamino)uracil phosphatase
MIEAVLFDADQTLWDFQKVMGAALAAVLIELREARPGPLTDALSVRDLSSDRDHVARELEGIEFNLARLRRLGFDRTLQRLRQAGDSSLEDDALAARLTSSYFTHRDADPALFDDTLPGLRALQGHYRLGILSNGSRLPDSVGLGGMFEVVVFAQDHGATKPDRRLFAEVERQMDVGPHDCVLVGDHPLSDVVGAKRSGWRAVWIDREGDGDFHPPPGRTEEPDAIISSLLQLPDILRQF